MNFQIFREDWGLFRKGEEDARRHQEKLKEIIRQRLPELITEESLILADDRRKVRIPLRLVEEFRFRFASHQEMLVGQAGSQPGADETIVFPGTGRGGGAGTEPGIDYYEAEVSVEEIAEVVFEELALPHYEPKNTANRGISEEWADLRRQGIRACLDRRRTLLNAFKRHAKEGGKGGFRLCPSDLRFRVWRSIESPEARAVVLAMLDTSGSMGPLEKYLARSFFFWMVRFLEANYANVEVVYLAHHAEARETTASEFFRKGESGGTRCSSVYELALDIIETRYPPTEYNIYAFHFSDGDNLPADNERCVELIGRLLEVANLVGYGEIEGPYFYTSTLKTVYQSIAHPRLVVVTLRERKDVYRALKAFFARF